MDEFAHPRVGIVVPAAGGDEGWLDGAWRAGRALRRDGIEAHVVVGSVPADAAEWDVAVLHGIQYIDDARALADGSRAVIVSDVPAGEHDDADPAPAGLTMIDWNWRRGAREAGRAAAREVAGPIGFIAGPPVPTQQSVVAAFVDGVLDVDSRREVSVIHVPTFLSVEHGERAGRYLAEVDGCALVAHSADAPGSAGTRQARACGASTYGFLTPVGDDAASLRSDITGVLRGLVHAVISGEATPARYTCSWENAEVALERP